MTDEPPPQAVASDPSLAGLLDQICDRFETACKSATAAAAGRFSARRCPLRRRTRISRVAGIGTRLSPPGRSDAERRRISHRDFPIIPPTIDAVAPTAGWRLPARPPSPKRFRRGWRAVSATSFPPTLSLPPRGGTGAIRGHDHFVRPAISRAAQTCQGRPRRSVHRRRSGTPPRGGAEADSVAICRRPRQPHAIRARSGSHRRRWSIRASCRSTAWEPTPTAGRFTRCGSSTATVLRTRSIRFTTSTPAHATPASGRWSSQAAGPICRRLQRDRICP